MDKRVGYAKVDFSSFPRFVREPLKWASWAELEEKEKAMKDRRVDRVKELLKKVWPDEKLKFPICTVCTGGYPDDDGLRPLSPDAMYVNFRVSTNRNSAPVFFVPQMVKLAEVFNTDLIKSTLDRRGGCETCGYGDEAWLDIDVYDAHLGYEVVNEDDGSTICTGKTRKEAESIMATLTQNAEAPVDFEIYEEKY